MDWNDPLARLALIERIGPADYNRQLEAHRAASVIETVGGHAIRRTAGLYAVGGTRRAFATLDQARAFAEANPAEPNPAAPGA